MLPLGLTIVLVGTVVVGSGAEVDGLDSGGIDVVGFQL